MAASQTMATADAAAANLQTSATTNAAMGGLVNYEIQRLTNEINNLKEANKALEEKKVVSYKLQKLE